MQIKAIVLYGFNGKRRVLDLKTGTVNIITGRSKTGKTAIADIIDYCFCSDNCNIAEGVIREKVEWFALQLIHDNEFIFIARKILGKKRILLIIVAIFRGKTIYQIQWIL